MKKKITRVLVTAVGGDIAQGVVKSLRTSSRAVKIIGTDINEYAAGLFLCDVGYIVHQARISEKQYISDIVRICNTEKIDIAFVIHESELEVITKHAEFLKQKTKTQFVIQSRKTHATCHDKYKTYQFLEKHGIRVPETYVAKAGLTALVQKHGYPVVIKPRKTSGSRDFYMAKSRGEFQKIFFKAKNLLVQEYISNTKQEEYTVGVFLDKQSRALGSICMLRKMRFGLTSHAVVGNFFDVTKTAIAAAECVKAVGPCNVQLRRDKNNIPCVLEINARISSTTAFRAQLGFNEAIASIDSLIHNKKPRLRFKKAVVMKIWDELIVPISKFEKLKKIKKIVNKRL